MNNLQSNCQRNRSIIASILIGAQILSVTTIGAQAFVETLTVGAILKQLRSEISSVLNQAQDTGNFLIARAAVESKDALDLWESHNKSLINLTFDRLDESSRQLFERVDKTLDGTIRGAKGTIESAKDLADIANQIVEQIPTNRGTYVTRFIPRIVPPNAKDSFVLRIRGVNLDSGDPKILNMGSIPRSLIGPVEANFVIPLTKLKSSPDRITLNGIVIQHSAPDDGFFNRVIGRRHVVERQMPVITLPSVMGYYTVKVKRTYEARIEKSFDRDLGQFKAKNSRVYRVATPEPGWRWVVDSARTKLLQGGGEAGRCDGIDYNQSSENGITVYAQLDKITNWTYPGGTDGYVNCVLRGIEYRTESKTDDMPEIKGTLNWNSDVSIDLPDGVSSIIVKVHTFDGRDRIFDGIGSDKYFDINRLARSIVISPRVPSDVIE